MILSGASAGKSAAERMMIMGKSVETALFEITPEIQQLVKAADKLSAYIKCLEELKAGNTEFKQAAEQTRYALDDMELPELDYFLENFLPSFKLTLDELE